MRGLDKYTWWAVALVLARANGEDGVLQGRQFPVQEYCDSETFKAECDADEVIVITLAHYGRHTFERCITTNYPGSSECKTDVILAVDALCSGLRKCEFEIDDDTFASYHPCPIDFKSHFSVAYKCVPVHVPKMSCRGSFSSNPSSMQLRTISLPDVTSGPRYISSDITRTTGCGATAHPWILTSPGSQKIELTMIDFSLNGTTASNADASRNPLETGVCMVYASVREGDDQEGTHRRSSTICGRLQPRIRHQFTSSSSRIEIRVLQADVMNPANDVPVNKRPRFLLKYQLVGCTDPPQPRGGWARKLGETSAVFGCDADPDTERWRMSCDVSTWKGHLGNCTRDAETAFLEQFVGSVKGLPFGLSVALVVAIAFVVSCLILLIGICIITRRNTDKRRQQELQMAASIGRGELIDDPQQHVFVDQKSKYHVIKSNQLDNMYTDSDTVSKNGQTPGVAELYTLRSEEYAENLGKYSEYRRPSGSRSTEYYPASEHIYEYPSPEKMAIDYSKMGVPHVPHYFDIDPAQSHGVKVPDVPKGPRDPMTRNNSARGLPTSSTGTGSHVIPIEDI